MDSELEWESIERRKVFTEALHQPESTDEDRAQQAKFRTWLADERFKHLWPMLERLIKSEGEPSENGSHSNRVPVNS